MDDNFGKEARHGGKRLPTVLYSTQRVRASSLRKLARSVRRRMPMEDAAKRFRVAYGTVRNWAHQFRAVHDQGDSSPFFFRPHGDVPRVGPRANSLRKNRKWQTENRCLWKWDVG